jgi:hypothetical protein
VTTICDFVRLTFSSGLFQDRMLSPHLYLDRIVVPCLLSNDTYRHRYATSDL